VAKTRIISIIGRKNAGKTTLTVALASELRRRNYRVMTIKHGHHSAQVDREGTDSWRHFHEGKAERVLLATPGLRAVIERSEDEYDPVALARRYLAGADIVLAEGYKRSDLPKIEVYRSSLSDPPLYDPKAPNADEWVAIVTDDIRLDASCPLLHFQDTMWLQLLASLAWDQAREIPD
jgi:molybdopterin-guanine dinucleotide biosynthesis protein B